MRLSIRDSTYDRYVRILPHVVHESLFLICSQVESHETKPHERIILKSLRRSLSLSIHTHDTKGPRPTVLSMQVTRTDDNHGESSLPSRAALTAVLIHLLTDLTRHHHAALEGRPLAARLYYASQLRMQLQPSR